MVAHSEIDDFRLKLKSAIKTKLLAERKMFQARNMERTLNERLAMIKSEIEFAKEKLEVSSVKAHSIDFKNQLSQSKQKLAVAEIFYVSEKTKKDALVAILEEHKKKFQHLFDIDRFLFDMRMKEMQDKEAEEEEERRQREKEVAEKNERAIREAAAAEATCQALEKECAVLKKRNHAIMLKLRRRLLEAENARRELAKRNN